MLRNINITIFNCREVQRGVCEIFLETLARASFSQIAVRLSRINSTLPLSESSKFANIENFTLLFRKDNYERKRVLRRTQETFSGRFGVPDLNVLDYRKMARAECERNGEGMRNKLRSRASSRASQFVARTTRAEERE